MNINLPSYLTRYIDQFRSVKCRAWYIVKCVSYCYENNIDIYEYYESIANNERTERTSKEGKNRGIDTML